MNKQVTKRQAVTMYPPATPAGSMRNTVRRLGWLSIGLGTAGLLAPDTMCRCLGLNGRTRVMTVFGLREIGTGIGILAADDPTPWVWARAGGDALDIATLSTATTDGPVRQSLSTAALLAVAGITIVDVLCAHWLTTFNARRALPLPDYSNRSGFPRPAAEMRGKVSAPAKG